MFNQRSVKIGLVIIPILFIIFSCPMENQQITDDEIIIQDNEYSYDIYALVSFFETDYPVYNPGTGIIYNNCLTEIKNCITPIAFDIATQYAFVIGKDNDGIPHCWKIDMETDNIEELELSPSTNSAYTTDIQVCENDIYISGYIIDEELNFIPCYWKNGEINYLNNNFNGKARNMTTTDILVNDQNVYILGDSPDIFPDDENPSFVSYWKNEIKYDLTSDSSLSLYSQKMTVDNENNIYIAGYYTLHGSVYTPCYWINDAQNRFDFDIITDVNSMDILLQNSHVYFMCNNIYWIDNNNNKYEFEGPIYTDKIEIFNNYILVFGFEFFDSVQYDPVYPTTYDRYKGCYWKNGNKAALFDEVVLTEEALVKHIKLYEDIQYIIR